jgi:hypothetical protein
MSFTTTFSTCLPADTLTDITFPGIISGEFSRLVQWQNIHHVSVAAELTPASTSTKLLVLRQWKNEVRSLDRGQKKRFKPTKENKFKELVDRQMEASEMDLTIFFKFLQKEINNGGTTAGMLKVAIRAASPHIGIHSALAIANAILDFEKPITSLKSNVVPFCANARAHHKRII